MPTFSYAARDDRGRRVTGFLEALDADTLARRLAATGYTVTRIDERAERQRSIPLPAWAGGVAARDRISLYLELGTLLRAGIPLTSALGDLEQGTVHRRLREALGEVRRCVQQGEGLSAAMRTRPGVFPALTCELVEAGESTGRLDETFHRLAQYAEREEEIATQVSAAVRYPALVFVAALGVVGVTLTYTLPAFSRVFARMNAELPLITRIFLAVGLGARAHGLEALAVLLAMAAGAVWLAGRPWAAAHIDACKLRLPAIGPLVRKLAIARFARTLGLLTAGGIPILQALDVSARVTGNDRIRRAIDRAAGEVRRGAGLAAPLGESGEFPPVVIRMIGVGEKTGRLDALCDALSEHYDLEIPRAVKELTTYLEVVLIMVMGAFVALVAFAFLMPMARMLDLI
jgi:type IV pilus assembly protein PilC